MSRIAQEWWLLRAYHREFPAMRWVWLAIALSVGILWYGYQDTQATIADCLDAGGTPLKQNVSICVGSDGRIIQ